MKKGIFDRVLFFLDPRSPLRSDRMMGFYATAAMVAATVMGYDWSASADMQTVNFVQELFTGASGMVTSLSMLVMTLGQIRSRISDRQF